MIILIAILLGIVTGILLKGNISNLREIKIEKKVLIILAFVTQMGAEMLSFNEKFSFLIQYSIIITILSFILLLSGFWYNRHLTGILVLGTGAFLNTLVMVSNGGKMPVIASVAIDTSKHTIINDATKLSFLADTIQLPGNIGIIASVMSVGDIIVMAGVYLLIVELTIAKGLIAYIKETIQKRTLSK